MFHADKELLIFHDEELTISVGDIDTDYFNVLWDTDTHVQYERTQSSAFSCMLSGV